MAEIIVSGGKTYKPDGSYVDYHDFWAAVTVNSSSIENNTSNITVALKLQRTNNNNGAYNLDRLPDVTLKINGVSKTPTRSYIDLRNKVVCTFATWTGNVTHNDDGTLNLPIEASFTHYGSDTLKTGTLSGTAKLPTISRASVPTVSKNSATMLESVTINTNRNSSALTHDLTYSFGGSTGTIASDVGASHKWTIPDLVANIPGKTSATCTITCKTKIDGAVIGTETVTLTLNVPAASVPTASVSTAKMGTKLEVYTNRKSNTYRHTLKYSIGSASGTIASDVGGGKAWTPPKDLAASTGNKLSATCTITCETYNGTKLVGTETMQITLTVPEATVPTLSASSIVLGNSITIYTPREASCYEHFITYKVKNYGSNTVLDTREFSGAIQESYTWTPSTSLLAPIISGTKGTISISCTTRFKDSTVVVGTAEDAVSFTFTVPDDNTTRPEVAMTVTPVDDFNGFYLAGKSKVTVEYSASSSSSTITSYRTIVENNIGTENPYTSDVLNTTGTVTITGEVTDNRGYSTILTENIEVIPYGRPRIIPGEGKSEIVCKRCNSDGTPDPGGVYLLLQMGRKYNKVMQGGKQNNYCRLSYQWKPDSDDDDAFSEPVELLSGTATTDYVNEILGDIVTSNTAAYTIRLIAEDDVGETDTVRIVAGTAFAAFHVPIGGHGFTLGGRHDPAKYDVFDCKFDAEFPRNVSGRVHGLGKLPEIPESEDLDQYKEFGVYAVADDSIAATLLNCPSEKAGTLRVWSANGQGNTTGENVYIMQEYVCCDNSGVYRRSMYLSDSDSSWEYLEWTPMSGFTQGTTDGWSWRKYSDGTAECWLRKENASRNVDTQMDNGAEMYYANCDEVTFPFDFASVPVVTATVEAVPALILMSWQGTDGTGLTTVKKPASYRVCRPLIKTNAAFVIAYHAIGRWK